MKPRPEDSVARVIASWEATRPDLNVDAIGITARLARLHAVMASQQVEVLARFGLRGGSEPVRLALPATFR